MKIYEEAIISLMKPQYYYKFKNEPLSKIFRFQMLITLIGFAFSNLASLFKRVFNRNLPSLLNLYKAAGPLNVVLGLIYMWLGVLTASLILSFIFYTINLFRKVENLKFIDVFNYTTHTLIICAILGSFLGPFVIFFAFSYYFLALKGEKVKMEG